MIVTVYITVADYWKLKAEELLRPYKNPVYFRNLVERFILPEIGSRRFTELVVGDLEAILRHARERGVCPDMCRQIKTMMRKLFTLAHQERLIPELLVDRLSPIPHRETEFRRLTTEQELRLLDAFRYTGQPELYTLILITGISYQELGACWISDLDREEKRLWLRRELRPRFVQQREEKDIRWIPLADISFEILCRTAEKAALRLPEGEDGPLFRLKYSDTDSYNRVPQEDYAIIRQRSGLEHIRFKDIERSFGIRAIELGVNPRVLNDYLGYKSASQVMRYASAQLSYQNETDSLENCFPYPAQAYDRKDKKTD